MLSKPAKCQENDHAFFIKDIYDYSLTKAGIYDRLYHLSENIGGRMTGSKNAENAVDYTYDELEKLGVDRVWKQKCMVPNWKRYEEAKVEVSADGSNWHELYATALGNSIGTEGELISGDIIEVFSLDTLELLGKENLKDKIVFFNRPMNPTRVHTGWAYGGAVDQRTRGAAIAGRYGAKAVLVRSMTTLIDTIPHTGVTSYGEEERQIPAIAISTVDAEQLSAKLKMGSVTSRLSVDCGMEEEAVSYNVVAEIKGSVYPDSIILVGGHLDSWDLGGGAHDDGAGCMHSIQVFETLKALNYKPRHTLRCVMFMNEENGLAGGLVYAAEADSLGEFHLAAIESDMGGFTPRGFGCSARDDVFNGYLGNFQSFSKFLDPYDLYLKAGGGGADISPLKPQGGLLIGFRPDPQRYFDIHHTKLDRMAVVHKRELELGAAAITSLVYLLDQFGLDGIKDE